MERGHGIAETENTLGAFLVKQKRRTHVKSTAWLPLPRTAPLPPGPRKRSEGGYVCSTKKLTCSSPT